MDYMREYEKWLASPALTPEEHAELESIRGDEKEIRERFYGPLEFGTAGLRGTMKAGLHQMNVHVIRWATQGFANVICAEGEEAKRRGVALCMDCRNHSMEFARAAAEVCAANGIHVRIFESLRPTPELSFAVREYGCQAGINPKEYNGYKVYWSDGAQLPPQHAAAIARELEHIDIFTGVRRMAYDDAAAQGLIQVMGRETDDRFMAHVMAMVNDRQSMAQVADTFKMVCGRYDRRKRVWVYCTPLRSANRTAAISKNTPHTSSSFCQRKRKSQSCTRFTPCHLLLFRFARSAASRGLWRSGRHPAPVYCVWFFAGHHRLCGLLHCAGEAATAPHAGATVR